MKNILFIICFLLFEVYGTSSFSQKTAPKFRVLVMAEAGGVHKPFVDTAKLWLEKLANDSSFTIDYIENADKINESFLSQFQVFIQLNFPPYTWSQAAMTAFEKYISEGKGMGWIGFHHATLLGEFDGYPLWPWFSDFMGGIQFKNYIPNFATGTVKVEDTVHPCMKGVAPEFVVENEEWYTYDKSPRANVHVLASVNESTYRPETDVKMGDHPVVWTNEHMKARNIYIFMGHHPDLFNNNNFKKLFLNSIFWAAGR